MTAVEKIKAKMNTQTERQACAVYSGLRLIVMRARIEGKAAPEGLGRVMVIAGEALEARIGETAFFALIDRIDTHLAA